jgi:peptidase E
MLGGAGRTDRRDAEGDSVADIVAIGGGGFRFDGRWSPQPSALTRYALRLTGRDDPRVSSLHTAVGDAPERILNWYNAFAGTPVRADHLALYPMPNHDDVRAHLLSQDAIFVNGGSTVNLLALWNAHGLVPILREAWESGVVLWGVSAGMLCWFDSGVTDSFSPRLDPFTGGLGLLPGSACPHYDEESERRPVYTGLVASGALPAGVAADGGAGLHFRGTELHQVVAQREGASGWRVTPDGTGGVVETNLPAILLDADGTAASR